MLCFSTCSTPQAQVDLVETIENVDGPESGFEALAQVIACEDIIGWRNREAAGSDKGLVRVVLFFTDENIHSSGEGWVSRISILFFFNHFPLRSTNLALTINQITDCSHLLLQLQLYKNTAGNSYCMALTKTMRIIDRL